MSDFDFLGSDDLAYIMESQPREAAYDVDAFASAAKDAMLKEGGRFPVSPGDVDAARQRVERSPANWETAYDVAMAGIGGGDNDEDIKLCMFIAKDVSL